MPTRPPETSYGAMTDYGNAIVVKSSPEIWTRKFYNVTAKAG